MKRSAPLARKTPLARSAPLKSDGSGLRRTRLAKRSLPQAGEAGCLHEVYALLGRTREPVCAGCGRAGQLSHSHLVPRSFNKQLVTEPANIAYHCLDWMGRRGCHSIWESNAERHTLLDYERNMAFIEKADPAYYRLLVLKTTA